MADDDRDPHTERPGLTGPVGRVVAVLVGLVVALIAGLLRALVEGFARAVGAAPIEAERPARALEAPPTEAPPGEPPAAG